MKQSVAFDVLSYLDDAEIPYSATGNNISSKGWIGLSCPFCDDPSTHLGINLDTKAFKCWVCGATGGPEKLVKTIENISWYEAKSLVEKYTDWSLVEFVDDAPKKKDLVFPKEFQLQTPEEINPLVKNYLLERNFNPTKELRKRKVFYSGPIGKFRYRIILPVTYNKAIVNFTGRALSEQTKPRYKGCPNEESGINLQNLIYGLDDVQEGEPIVLVEGIFDQWRLGLGSVAIFGINLTTPQTLQLYRKSPSKVFILLDPGVKDSVIRNIESKIWFAPVEVITLETDRDPADLTYEEADSVMKEIMQWK